MWNFKAGGTKVNYTLKKILLVVVAFMVFLEIIYIAAGNYFIRSKSFQELVNADPQEVFIKFDSAFTLFPGLVSMKGFLIEGQSGSVFWQVKIDKVRALLDFSTLRKRMLRVQWVDGDGGAFKMKLGLPRLPPKSTPSNPKGPFRFYFNNISVKNFRRADFHQYSLIGKINIQGAFQLWPGRELQVYPDSNVAIANSVVDVQGLSILTELNGKVLAAISNYFPDADPDPVIMDKSDAHIILKGVMNDAEFFNYYLASIPWLKIPAVSGEFNSDVRIVKGNLIEPSQASIKAKKIVAAMGDYQLQGRGSASWSYSADKKLSLLLRLNQFEGLHSPQNKVFLKGDSFALSANTFDSHLRSIFSNTSKLSASLIMPKATISDLRFINEFIPENNKFDVKSGSAQLEATLNVSATGSAAPGKIKISAKRATFVVDKTEISGDMNLNATITDMVEGTDVFQINEATLSLSDVLIPTEGPTFKAWSGDLWFEKSFIQPRQKKVFFGRLRLNFQDARPVFSVLAPISRVASWVEKLATMKDLKGRADFVMGPKLIDISNLNLDTTDLDVKGRVRFLNKNRSLAALVKYGIFRVGIQIENDKSQTKLLGATKWFRAREHGPALPEEYSN